MSRRSVLFSPGDRPDLMRKAPSTGADTIVFDLEDAVAPTRKDDARTAVRDVLSDPEFDSDAEVCVRVNPGSSDVADFDAILDDALRLDAIMVPKVTGLDDVVRVEERMTQAGFDLPVLSLVESAAGVLNASAIASASATDALVFGAEDLAADIGATRTNDGDEVLYAREHVVLAASAAGVDAIDTVYTDFQDSTGLANATEFALTLGYDGKMAIHPAQVDIINDAFTPDAERIEWARTVLSARGEAESEGRGVFSVDDQMIDAPLITQAERVRERAKAADAW